ncbi:MAG: peptidyl-prolyl cis-trans isomerase [Alphaproteobacteria bacterium]|nr:peptidyl-prolyl cis-trans isomerase [Alphaproteobacteria bacterium]
MLQAIRSKATSLIVKILFGVLIVTFGIWGIGDIFRNRSVDTAVASVDGEPIQATQLQQAVRADIERLRGSLGGTSLTMDQAKRLGLVDSALNRLIESKLLAQEAGHLDLRVGDEAVRRAIVGNPNFRGSNGQFDRNLYNQILAANRLSDAQYEQLLRADLTRNELTIALTEGIRPPQELTDAIYRAEAERRVADMVILPPSAVAAPGRPSAADLDAYYKAHQDEFRTPERRDVTLATLTIDDVAKTMDVPDSRLHDAYQARLDEFHTPETRQLQQLLLSTKAKADEAETQLKAGKNFAAVAKAVAGADPSTLDLGWMRQQDLPKALAGAAFTAKQGGVTPPIQDSFGWHILRVVAIKPAQTQNFDQVKAKLRQDVARDMAGDRIAQLANHIDDALAGGGGLDAVAKQFGMKMTILAGMDAQGALADGKTADLPSPKGTVLQAAFSTAAGQTSELGDLGDDGYYIVHVDKITPSGVPPLDQVRDKVVAAWQAQQRIQALAALGKQIADQVNAGQSLAAIAKKHKLVVSSTGPVLRTGNSRVPPALVGQLFALKAGAATTAPDGNAYVVAQLTAIQTPDPTKDKAAVDALSHRLAQQMQGEFLNEFAQALRARYPVEINKTNLDRAL